MILVQVFDERAKLIEATQPVIDVLSQEEVIQELRPDPRYNQEYLHTRWNVDLAAIEKLYDYGRLQFSFGAYEPAALYLANYRVLSTDMDKCMYALWGKLAAEILVHQWDLALDSLTRLRELIDDPKNPGMKQLPPLPSSTLRSGT
jgi:translation initiation factor 3 subunit E